MPTAMENIEAVVSGKQQWLLSQPGVAATYAGMDANGVPTLFVMGGEIPEVAKNRIRQEVQAPVKFVEGMQIRPL